MFKFLKRKLFSSSCLGIDIGTSSIKIVELSNKKGKRLANYGQLKSEYFSPSTFRSRTSEGLFLFNENIIEAIKAILNEAKIQEKRCIFAIPDFSTFFTSFELPPMSYEELKEAVKYEAPRHIPLPLSDVTLDWEIIKGAPGEKGRTPLKILLVAVPNQVIKQYQQIANALNLELEALEAEVFALARALIKYQDAKRVVALIDIGEKSTTINVVSKNILKISYSTDVSGEEITKVIQEKLEINKRKAEIIKRMLGIKKEETLKEILLPLIQQLTREIENVFRQYFAEEREKPEKIILSGGSALLPGLREFFQQKFNLPVEIANPFLGLSYPPGLEEVLKKIGPEFTIAVGTALRGLT